MAKKNTTINNGTDFIDVRIEVSDECTHGEKAVQMGIGSALKLVGRAASLLYTAAQEVQDPSNAKVSAKSRMCADGVECIVHVHGRIRGVRPLLVGAMLKDISDLIIKPVFKVACDVTSEDLLSDVMKMAGEEYAGFLDDEMPDVSERAFNDSARRGMDRVLNDFDAHGYRRPGMKPPRASANL